MVKADFLLHWPGGISHNCHPIAPIATVIGSTIGPVGSRESYRLEKPLAWPSDPHFLCHPQQLWTMDHHWLDNQFGNINEREDRVTPSSKRGFTTHRAMTNQAVWFAETYAIASFVQELFPRASLKIVSASVLANSSLVRKQWDVSCQCRMQIWINHLNLGILWYWIIGVVFSQ